MARLHISSKSGRVRVRAEAAADFTVDGAELRVDADGTAHVKGKSKTIDIRCSPGTDLVIGTASGSVEVVGQVGAVKVSCASGSIEIEHADEVDARTASGSVKVGMCEGECRVVCASGSVRVGGAGRAAISAVSGSISADDVGSAELKSVSGTIEVGANGEGRIGVKTVSGTVRVTVPRSTAPTLNLKSMSGRIRRDVTEGRDYEISVGTVSGTIEVTCR